MLTASASRLGGGVAEAVVQHAGLIDRLGMTPVVVTLDDAHSDEARVRLDGVELALLPVSGPRMIGYAPGMIRALLAARIDILHLHGIWMYPSRAATVWARRTGRPYVISPHGMLDRWITSHGRSKKALARAGYESASWRAADAFHALTVKEAEDVARETGRGDSIVIANPAPAISATGNATGLPPPHVVYLGRIHAKKNLLALIDAWEVAQGNKALPRGACLSIAGWGDDADVAQLQARLARSTADIAFIGPCYGAEKAALIASARFTVLPSHSEGLPMAILESWAAGVPTIMSEECNLPEGFAAGAALDSRFDAQSIANALTKALAMPLESWQSMRAAAIALTSGPFSSEAIACKWRMFYDGLLANGDRL